MVQNLSHLFFDGKLSHLCTITEFTLIRRVNFDFDPNTYLPIFLITSDEYALYLSFSQYWYNLKPTSKKYERLCIISLLYKWNHKYW